MAKLTKAQREILDYAVNRNEGEVRTYGVLGRTIEILRKEGYIRLVPKLDDLTRQNTLDVAYRHLDTAHACLNDYADKARYGKASKSLTAASALFVEANAEIYHVTEKAILAFHTPLSDKANT